MKSKNVVAGLEERNQEVSGTERTQPPVANGPSFEEIRRRAYELHLERDCIHGKDYDDWLQAERELVEKHEAR